jgi:hypothetical protein
VTVKYVVGGRNKQVLPQWKCHWCNIQFDNMGSVIFFECSVATLLYVTVTVPNSSITNGGYKKTIYTPLLFERLQSCSASSRILGQNSTQILKYVLFNIGADSLPITHYIKKIVMVTSLPLVTVSTGL